MEVRGNYIIFCDEDNNAALAIKKDEIAGMCSANGDTEIHLSGNRQSSFTVSCTIDEILSKIDEGSALHGSHEDNSDAVIDGLRKEHRALLSALTQIRDYGQEKIDQCRSFDTDSLVNLGDIIHITDVTNEALSRGIDNDPNDLLEDAEQ